MNRTDLQQLAEDRLLDAEALLNAGRWAGAYYLAGYVVECALKACIAKQTNLHDFPSKTFANKVFTHNLLELLKAAGLETDFEADSRRPGNEPLQIHWKRARNWSEEARYQQQTETQARELFEAVTDPSHGVLPWIKTHW